LIVLFETFEPNLEPVFSYTYNTQELPFRLRTGRRGVGAFVKKVYNSHRDDEQNPQPLLQAGYEVVAIDGRPTPKMLFDNIVDHIKEVGRPITIEFRTCAWCTYFSPCVLDKEVNFITSSPDKGFNYIFSRDFFTNSTSIVWNLIWQFSNYDLPVQMFDEYFEDVLDFEPKNLDKFLHGDDAILKILGHSPAERDSSSTSFQDALLIASRGHSRSLSDSLRLNPVPRSSKKKDRKKKKAKRKSKLSSSFPPP